MTSRIVYRTAIFASRTRLCRPAYNVLVAHRLASSTAASAKKVSTGQSPGGSDQDGVIDENNDQPTATRKMSKSFTEGGSSDMSKHVDAAKKRAHSSTHPTPKTEKGPAHEHHTKHPSYADRPVGSDAEQNVAADRAQASPLPEHKLHKGAAK